MPHQYGRDLAPDPGVLLGEMANRNHSITWITETIIGNTVTNGAHLVRIRGCCQDNDSDVTVAGGKCVSVHVGKIERVDLPSGKSCMQG